MLDASISFRIIWVEEGADGQECFNCEDKAYLFPVMRLHTVLGSGKSKKSINRTNIVVCIACFNATELCHS